MSDKLHPLRGMKDLVGKDAEVHEFIINSAKTTGLNFGYQSIVTPILEYTKVFDRTLGDSSDVVSKEMYCFLDKSGDSVALRPEFTAGVMRAFISNGLQQHLPLKLFSAGPVFRYDRPQAGRQRQFNQINFEHLGALGSYSDAEVISLAVQFLENIGVIDDVVLELNSLGCAESRQNYQRTLVEYFQQYYDELSEDSKKRLAKNPLRILDSKDPRDKEIAASAPLLEECYTEFSRSYFDEVRKYLDSLGIKYIVNPRLVRGLDYYCHTAFEFVTDKLGAQSAVLAGGRYDGLCKLMGGPEVPAIGFAAGIERLALLANPELTEVRYNYILPIGEECAGAAFKLADDLRRRKIPALVEISGKMSKRMQRAVSANALNVIFIGEEELKSGNCKLKKLDSGEELSVKLDEAWKMF